MVVEQICRTNRSAATHGGRRPAPHSCRETIKRRCSARSLTSRSHGALFDVAQADQLADGCYPEVLQELRDQCQAMVVAQDGGAKAVIQDVLSHAPTQESRALQKVLARGNR